MILHLHITFTFKRVAHRRVNSNPRLHKINLNKKKIQTIDTQKPIEISTILNHSSQIYNFINEYNKNPQF